jgi:hypothetical protein
VVADTGPAGHGSKMARDCSFFPNHISFKSVPHRVVRLRAGPRHGKTGIERAPNVMRHRLCSHHAEPK